MPWKLNLMGLETAENTEKAEASLGGLAEEVLE